MLYFTFKKVLIKCLRFLGLENFYGLGIRLRLMIEKLLLRVVVGLGLREKMLLLLLWLRVRWWLILILSRRRA